VWYNQGVDPTGGTGCFYWNYFVQNLGLTFAEARKHIKIVFRSVRNKKTKIVIELQTEGFMKKVIDVKKTLTHVKEKIKGGRNSMLRVYVAGK